MKLIVRFVLVLTVVVAGFLGLTTGTASADYPCAGKGGVVFAQASGVGPESSVEVQCRDGSWELY